MNVYHRSLIIRAMESLVCSVNNTELILLWRTEGVADGDIHLSTSNDVVEYYIEDNVFSELMDTFLYIMSRAQKDGGLYVDGVISKPME